MKPLTPEEFFKEWIKTRPKEIKVGGRNSSKIFNFYMSFTEAYTKHFIENAVSDEEINDRYDMKEYPQSFHFRRSGAKWFKQQLLKKIK